MQVMQVNTESKARAQAALKEKGWEPWTPGCCWEGELAVGRSADGEYEASLWANPDDEPGTPWLCDVGVTVEIEKESLWLLGIPRPKEVPALLKRHADILSVGHEGRTLDLATGRVIVEGQDGIAAVVRDVIRVAQDGIAKREGILREIVAAGWDPDHLELSVRTWGREADVWDVTAGGESSEPDSFLYLHVDLYRDDVSRISVEDPGHGIRVPIADWTTNPGGMAIPTPDEAGEAYGAALKRGEVVARQQLVYRPRLDL